MIQSSLIPTYVFFINRSEIGTEIVLYRNDSLGFLPSSLISCTTGPAPRSRGLYNIRNKPIIPTLNVIDPTLSYRKPKTPDPASSDDEFDSTMPSDDGQPLPPASSLPHPVTNYFCRIGRAIEDLPIVGYRSRILPAVPGDWVEYAHYISWYNRASQLWESLPNGYTTEEPRATHPLGDVQEWWEEAEMIIERRARQSGNKTESGDEKESGNEVESGDEKEYRHAAESRHEADQDCKMGYRSESSLTPSDYSESKRAALLRREHARKNRGLGHDEMDTAEEEADDEKIMEEEDEQEQRQMKNKKGSKKPSDTNHDNELGEDKVSRGRHHLVKGKQAAKKPSMDNGGSEPSEDFARKLRRLAKSKPPAPRPSTDSEGSDADAEDASEMPTARPATSTKALGKKRDDPAESMKRGPYAAHETQKAMELADTIVAYCKNMGRTPESVLRKGGFNVSLSRDASRWDIWQMYLRYQSYNPTKSKHIHVSFFVLCIGV